MDLTDSYTMFHPNSKEYIFFSTPLRPFSKTDHILSHKAHLNRYRTIEIATCVLSDCKELKVDVNNRKLTNSQKLNSSILNDYWVKTERNEKTF